MLGTDFRYRGVVAISKGVGGSAKKAATSGTEFLRRSAAAKKAAERAERDWRGRFKNKPGFTSTGNPQTHLKRLLELHTKKSRTPAEEREYKKLKGGLSNPATFERLMEWHANNTGEGAKAAVAPPKAKAPTPRVPKPKPTPQKARKKATPKDTMPGPTRKQQSKLPGTKPGTSKKGHSVPSKKPAPAPRPKDPTGEAARERLRVRTEADRQWEANGGDLAPGAPERPSRIPVKFVGRARKTGTNPGDPKERRILFADGHEAWVEEGSMAWDTLVAQEKKSTTIEPESNAVRQARHRVMGMKMVYPSYVRTKTERKDYDSLNEDQQSEYQRVREKLEYSHATAMDAARDGVYLRPMDKPRWLAEA